MSEAGILKVIAGWLLEHANIEPERVKMESSIADGLALDSLDQIEMIMAMEERFHIQIPDEEAGQLRTVGDAVRFIQQATAASTA